MSADPEVAGPPKAPNPNPKPSTGLLRVRPPSPLAPATRIVIAVVVVVLVVGGTVLVVQARSSDGDQIPGAAWRALSVPRSARVDDFERGGRLGDVHGFGAWQTVEGSLEASDGLLRSAEGEATATVDAGSADVLVHAQVVTMVPRSGLLISASRDGTAGLILRAVDADGWELVLQRSGVPSPVLQTFAAPTAGVSVQITRRGDQIDVAFDDRSYAVTAPPESSAGTYVGIASAGPGNELDLFGYLRLDAG